MATTIEDIKKSMAKAEVELGSHGMQILDHAEFLHEEFSDIEYLGDHRGKTTRWGSRDHYVYRLACGSLVGVQYYNGATESQESFYEGRVVWLKEESVVTYVEAG